MLCLGNRFLPADDLGPRVYDCLQQSGAGAGAGEKFDLLDGGLAGINLLGLLEGRRRVVIVDTVAAGEPGRVVVWSQERLLALAGGYGHGEAVPFLVNMARRVGRPPPAELVLVGAAAPADEQTVAAVADRCREVARDGE